MKRKIAILLVIFCFIFSIPAFAAEKLEVKATINGAIEKGNQVEILIDVSDIRSLYAASFYLKYDSKALKIEEIIPGELISDTKISKFEAVKSIDESKGLVSYGFTCLGNVNGFSGKGNILKLKATVMENKDINITSSFENKSPTEKNTLAIQICDKNIEELPYNFTPYKHVAPKAQQAPAGDNIVNNNDTANNNGEKAKSEGQAGENKAEEQSKNNEGSGTDKGEGLNSQSNEEKSLVKGPQNNNTESSSKKTPYVLGALGIVSLAGFGIYNTRKKKAQADKSSDINK